MEDVTEEMADSMRAEYVATQREDFEATYKRTGEASNPGRYSDLGMCIGHYIASENGVAELILQVQSMFFGPRLVVEMYPELAEELEAELASWRSDV